MDNCATLFDLDGVIIDTEKEYTRIWDEIRKRYYPHNINLAYDIKGQSLRQIFDTYFPDPQQQEDIRDFLTKSERNLTYHFIAGAKNFVLSLKKRHIPTALVTSSSNVKMQYLYKNHPEMKSWFDTVITADDITCSKPHPECYLLAAERLSISPQRCIVFEDSMAGMTAGKNAGMYVIGLSTTLPSHTVAKIAHEEIPDFTAYTYQKLVSGIEKHLKENTTSLL